MLSSAGTLSIAALLAMMVVESGTEKREAKDGVEC